MHKIINQTNKKHKKRSFAQYKKSKGQLHSGHICSQHALSAKPGDQEYQFLFNLSS